LTELGGQGLRITEEVAKKLAETLMKIEIYEINRETQAETLKEVLKIDLSCLLFSKTKFEVIII
jgi:hypothetical protein